jgi:hypothetical protein
MALCFVNSAKRLVKRLGKGLKNAAMPRQGWLVQSECHTQGELRSSEQAYMGKP